ncbi:MAG: hypothetical protein VKL97_05915 [Cyanobacteriota bacterium]|nr:hypothetical protein [Cyanobacteriota bacterium]
MAFDQRSLNKLAELGRTLPSPLPVPEAKPQRPRPQQSRHPLETETDPEKLFQQLMQASPDGNVPPHLLERLKELESIRPAASADQPRAGLRQAPKAQQRRQERQRKTAADADPLYVAFEQLLLEDEDGA